MSKADIPADNGVIHMITDVIYPFPTGNIAEIVTGDDRFSTLLAAVQAAGKALVLNLYIRCLYEVFRGWEKVVRDLKYNKGKGSVC